MTDEKKRDADITPIEPLMQRRRSSQNALTAIGWRPCPKCEGREGEDCDLCFDEADHRYNRKVPVDVWIEWTTRHADTDKPPPEAT